MQFKQWLMNHEAFSLFGTGPDSAVGEKEKSLAKGRNGEAEEGGLPVLQAKLPWWKRNKSPEKDYPTRA